MTATLERAGGGTAPTAPVPDTRCTFCVEGERYDLSVGRESEGVDAGVIRYDGKLACGWHGAFHFEDKPAKVFALLGSLL